MAPSAESPVFNFTCKEPQQQCLPLRGIQVPARASHQPTQLWAHPSPPPAWVCYHLQLMAWKPCHPQPFQQEHSSQALLRTSAKPPLIDICVKSCIYCGTLKALDPTAWGLGWQCQPTAPVSMCSCLKLPRAFCRSRPGCSSPRQQKMSTSTGKDHHPLWEPRPWPSWELSPHSLHVFLSPAPSHGEQPQLFMTADRSPEQITLICTSFLSSGAEPEQQ